MTNNSKHSLNMMNHNEIPDNSRLQLKIMITIKITRQTNIKIIK